MQINEVGLNFIKEREGFSSHPYYDDAHVPTIGYGFTYYPNGRRVTITDSPITEEEASGVLELLLRQYELATDSMTRDDITQNQFNALVSFCYNVGVQNLRGSTLLKTVNQNPNNPEIAEQFMRWVYSGHKKNKGLAIRRSLEAKLYFS